MENVTDSKHLPGYTNVLAGVTCITVATPVMIVHVKRNMPQVLEALTLGLIFVKCFPAGCVRNHGAAEALTLGLIFVKCFPAGCVRNHGAAKNETWNQ